MAHSITSKRQREETVEQNDDNQDCVALTETKKHKSFNHILSLLYEEEEEDEQPTQDLSPLITTLELELSSENPIFPNTDQRIELTTTIEDYESSASSSCSFSKEDEDDDNESIIKHLLEASDDALGIPNSEEVTNGCEEDEKDGFFEGGHDLCFDGLWEFEDVNANYYTLMQSQLFM